MVGNGWVGKRISVYFDDGTKVTRHDGLCTDNSSTEIELDNRELIPKSRIIRVEVSR